MSEEKKSSTGKRFAILSKESIKAYGESAGHSGLSDEVAALLAEDVVYRLREVTQNSCQFMKHAKRKKLTSEDFNKALRNADIPPIFGYGSSDAMSFRQTKEGELSFVEDNDVNLANVACGTHHLPHQNGKATVKAQWLSVEGMPKCQGLAGKTKKPMRSLSDVQKQYVENITKAVLGSETELTKLALNDLRTNPNISPLLPYLLNFIACGVKSSTDDIPQLNKFLQCVRALINNTSLFLQPKPYQDLLIESVTTCAVDPLSASVDSDGDHWALREFAARLLVQIIRSWESNGMEQASLDRMQEILYDMEQPLGSHYGAIVAIGTFGTQAVETILRPHLPVYMAYLETFMENNNFQKADAAKVYGAIQLCCEYVLRARTDALLKSPPTLQPPPQASPQHNDIKPEPSIKTELDIKTESAMDTSVTEVVTAKEELIGTVLQLRECSNNPYKEAADIYAEFSTYFGDSLSAKLPVTRVEGMYCAAKKDQSFVWSEAPKKTGEELLEEIMNAPLPPQAQTSAGHYNSSRGPSRMHSMATTDDSDLHSFFDDAKSEVSERSHPDDLTAAQAAAFVFDDSDLTVKSTVNDPSLGIRLTITKRSKTASESLAEEAGDAVSGGGGSAIHASKRRKLNPSAPRLDEAFPARKHVRNPKSIVFRIRGAESSRKKRQRRDTTTKPAESKYYKMQASLPTSGKSTAVIASTKNKMKRVHTCAASLNTLL